MTWQEEFVLNGLFYVFALAAVIGAVTVARSQNIIRSAFALFTLLVAVAALYALAGSDFVMAAQLFIYVGGIVVLLIFAVMLTHKISEVKLSNESTSSSTAFFVVVCLFYSICLIVFTGKWGGSMSTPEPVTAGIGKLLMNEYLLPFEAISLLLLAALIGAAFLARKEVKK